MSVQIKDFITAVPTEADYIPLSQSGNTRKSAVSAIKELLLGNTTLPTTDQTITGAIAEIDADLSEMMKQYKGFTAVNATYSATTPIIDVVTNMADNSFLVAETGTNSAGVYPTNQGTVRVFKFSIARNMIEITNYTGAKWLGSYHSSYGFSGWKQVADGTDTGWITLPLAGVVTNYDNAAYRKIGNRVIIRGRVSNITAQATLISTLPTGFRPLVAHRYANWKNGYNIVGFSIGTDGTLTVGSSDGATFTSTNFFEISTSFLVD